jgi:hypothetical protein
VNVETKKQSKQWMHTHSPKKKREREFKQTLSGCQKANGNRVLGQERSADGETRATRNTITLEVYCKTLKKLLRARYS